MKLKLASKLQVADRSRKTWVRVGAVGLAAVAAIGTVRAATPTSHDSPTAVGRGRTVFAAKAVANPKLTTNTPAPCNAPQPKNHFQCLAIVRTPSDHEITPDASGPPATALTPQQLQAAYNLPADSGGGQTVAIIDWGDDANAESDLATFRAQYGLPPCTTANGCFTKVNQEGQQGNYPTDQGTGIEISLDVDAVSAACPNCNILLVEANSNAFQDIGAAVDEAVTLGAKFVSNSYGTDDATGGEVEDPTETANDPFYNHPGVAVVASAGDGGWGVGYPAADPDVVSVGGTSLTADSSTSRGWEETVWGNGTQGIQGDGTGSGCSQFEPQPSWQSTISALTAACPNNRAVADLSADANPASGIAVYDTDPNDGPGGWEQVGGTSLSAPLITAMYAEAGTPAPNTFPVTYPYQDPNQSTDLNDITAGSNGNCGNILCNAGPGWDGPTGLGSPNGVQALAGAPHATITGQVTDASTGKPISGARVTANPGSEGTTTDANGNYTLTGLAPGTYTLTVSAFAFNTSTTAGITVTSGTATTQNVALSPAPSTTVSGTVSDGSGHGWPLYAQVSIDGLTGGPIFTNPATGKFSVTVPLGTLTFRVTPLYPGYQAVVQTVQVTQPNQAVNFTAQVSPPPTSPATVTGISCAAPGYGPDGISANFLGWTAGTAQDGWSVTGSKQGWRFDNPGNRQWPLGGDDHFAIADSAWAGNQTINTTLTSPTVNVAGQANPVISFDTNYVGAPQQSGTVQVSTDNGQHWHTLWQQTDGFANSAHLGPSGTPDGGSSPIKIALPANSGQVRVRFSFTGHDGGYWEIDNVLIGTNTCVPQPGGLIIGNATDAGTGADLPGVTIARAGDRDPADAAITAATPNDPNVGDGFYWLFAPAGSNQLTATDEGFTPARQAVSVKANQVTTLNWALKAS